MKISVVSILCTFLLINYKLCNAATLPENVNNTIDTTAIAKTTTAIVDVFEDIRWFFGRLGIFCELVEQMLPPQKRDGNQTKLSLNLQSGLRQFLLGVREISKSIVAVLSNKEVQEYQQLSRATDYAQEVVKSVGEFFRHLRLLMGRIFQTYNYYVPEVVLTKCIGNYLRETYSHRPMYEYPVLMINDIIESFQTPTNKNTDKESVRKIGSDTDDNFVKNVEQNEILDEDMYVFHNNPVSPTPELASGYEKTKTEENQSNGNEEVESNDDLKQDVFNALSWKKCFKIYATETIFRKLEFYFLERNE